MDIYALITIILVLLGAFAVVGGVAYFLQSRAKREGNLFTKPASPSSRIFAFLTGILFGGFFLMEISLVGKSHLILPVLSVLLLIYSMGGYRLIESLQKRDR